MEHYLQTHPNARAAQGLGRPRLVNSPWLGTKGTKHQSDKPQTDHRHSAIISWKEGNGNVESSSCRHHAGSKQRAQGRKNDAHVHSLP